MKLPCRRVDYFGELSNRRGKPRRKVRHIPDTDLRVGGLSVVQLSYPFSERIPLATSDALVFRGLLESSIFLKRCTVRALEEISKIENRLTNSLLEKHVSCAPLLKQEDCLHLDYCQGHTKYEYSHLTFISLGGDSRTVDSLILPDNFPPFSVNLDEVDLMVESALATSNKRVLAFDALEHLAVLELDSRHVKLETPAVACAHFFDVPLPVVASASYQMNERLITWRPPMVFPDMPEWPLAAIDIHGSQWKWQLPLPTTFCFHYNEPPDVTNENKSTSQCAHQRSGRPVADQDVQLKFAQDAFFRVAQQQNTASPTGLSNLSAELARLFTEIQTVREPMDLEIPAKRWEGIAKKWNLFFAGKSVRPATIVGCDGVPRAPFHVQSTMQISPHKKLAEYCCQLSKLQRKADLKLFDMEMSMPSLWQVIKVVQDSIGKGIPVMCTDFTFRPGSL